MFLREPHVMAQPACLIYFPVRNVFVSLTVSRDLQQAHCVTGWSLMSRYMRGPHCAWCCVLLISCPRWEFEMVICGHLGLYEYIAEEKQ